MKRSATYSAATGPNWRTGSVLTLPPIPEEDATQDIGSATKRFKSVYVQTVRTSAVVSGNVNLVANGVPENSFVAFGAASLARTNCVVIGNPATTAIRPPTPSAMSLGTPDEPFVNLNILGNIRGINTTRSVDDVLSCESAGVAGTIPTFVAGKVLTGSGVTLASLATTSGVAATYLPKVGGTLTGDILMNTGSKIRFDQSVMNRKIVLYSSTENDFQFYGIGIGPGIQRYNVAAQTDAHVFYAGVSSGASFEVARITGSGNLTLGNADVAGGTHVFALPNCTTVPPTTPASGGVVYVQGGALKYKGSLGTITTIAVA